MDRQHDLLLFASPVNNKRTLIAVMRRTELCDCGCQGWCGIYKVWAMVRWSLVALRAGQWPLLDQDENPLRGDHAERAGQDMGPCACLLFCKSDWAELVHTFGYPSWTSKEHPCPFCVCCSDDGLLEFPFDAIWWPFPAK